MAKRKGTTVSLVYVDVDPEHDAEFNDWYNQEHVPDMLKMPGYLNAGRYEALKGGPRYLAVYELESPEASETAEIKAYHANLTERSKKMSPPRIGRNLVYNVYTQIYPGESDAYVLGRGMVPALQIGRMDVPPDIEEKYNHYYDNIRLPQNSVVPGCIYARRSNCVVGPGPKYLTIYEFEHENVPNTLPWIEYHKTDTMNEYIGATTATRRARLGFTGGSCRPGPFKFRNRKGGNANGL